MSGIPLDGYADKVRRAAPVAEQGSAEWIQERIGYCTASRFDDATQVLKSGKYGEKRAAYLYDTVIERLTGIASDHYKSKDMEWGNEWEGAARMAYEDATGAMVERVGFIRHPTIKWCGGSPDGAVGPRGGLEIKCPKTKTHIITVLGEPCDYMPQCQGNIWLNGWDWIDFVSYDPRLPAGLNIHIERIKRNDGYIAKMEAEVMLFLAEAAVMEEKLRARITEVPMQVIEDDLQPLEL